MKRDIDTTGELFASVIYLILNCAMRHIHVTWAPGSPLKRSLSRLWRFPVEVAVVDVEDTVLEKDSDYVGAL